MRPPRPVILGLLADAEGLQAPAAGGGHRRRSTKATGSAPMVSPPMAVASSGMTSSMASADEQHPVGTADGLLGVDEPGGRAPRLEDEVARPHRVGQQVLAQGVEHAGWHRAVHRPGPAHRPASLRSVPPCAPPRLRPRSRPPPWPSARRARAPPRRRRRRRPRPPAPCPSPRLKTRAISSSSTSPRRRISAKIGGVSHVPASTTASAAGGQHPGQVAGHARRR